MANGPQVCGRYGSFYRYAPLIAWLAAQLASPVRVGVIQSFLDGQADADTSRAAIGSANASPSA